MDVVDLEGPQTTWRHSYMTQAIVDCARQLHALAWGLPESTSYEDSICVCLCMHTQRHERQPEYSDRYKRLLNSSTTQASAGKGQ